MLRVGDDDGIVIAMQIYSYRWLMGRKVVWFTSKCHGHGWNGMESISLDYVRVNTKIIRIF